jgi:chemotaxis protein methyltransferase CheR
MPLSRTDFEFVRNLLHQRSAIVLDEEKAYLAETAMQALARREGLASLEALMARLHTAPNNGLHQKVVESLANHETSFFRDLRPFDTLRRVVLPELLLRRSGERRLNLWSAACATGQEPYSVAMMLREHFPALRDWNVHIFASDLCQDVLERCRRGSFSQLEVNRGLPAQLLVKYFHKQNDNWLVKEEIRRMVDFRQINLLDPWPALPVMDVILLRNVLIYFDVDSRKNVLAKVRRSLLPDGCLLLGGA